MSEINKTAKLMKQQQMMRLLQNNPYYFDLELWNQSSWLAWKFMKHEQIPYAEKKHNLFTNTMGYALTVKIPISEENFEDFKTFYAELSEPSKKKFSDTNEFDFFTKKRVQKK